MSDHPLLLDYPDWWEKWAKRYALGWQRGHPHKQALKVHTLKCLWLCYCWVNTGIVAPHYAALCRGMNDIGVFSPYSKRWYSKLLRNASDRYQVQGLLLPKLPANTPSVVRWEMIRPKPWRHKRGVTIEEYAMGERGQSPLLYLGSPYLDFLDMEASVDGTHSPTLTTHSPQLTTHRSQLTSQSTNPNNELTDGLSTDRPHVDSCLSVREKIKQTAARIYLDGQLVENGLVDTTNSSATAEQSEILE